MNEDDPDSPATVVTVNVSNGSSGENSTELKFSMSLEPSSGNIDNDDDTTMDIQPSTRLPPHLCEMSQIFARYTKENTRSLQSQLDTARNTLDATREGAMDLQRQALKLQDDLNDAQSDVVEAKTRQEQTESELGRQKYEFERREQSFERVKEHYKAEIDRKETEMANMKKRHERELKEAKAEFSKVKGRGTDERDTERSSKHRSSEQRTTDHSRKRKKEISSSSRRKDEHHPSHHNKSEHRRRQGTPHPHPNLHAEAAAVAVNDDDQISPSIPRKIEYFATDPYDDNDLGRQSRHSSRRSGRQSRSTPHELDEDPLRSRSRRPRSLSEPKVRDRNYGSKKGDRLDESGGRYGRLGSSHNLLASLTSKNNQDDHITNTFSKKRGSGSNNRRERLTRKDEDEDQSDDEKKSKKHKVTRLLVNNPYIKDPVPARNGEPTFAYQEVVRGRDARAALPGHDCDECRKFLDALGPGFDREDIVNKCSRHRARHKPPSTPDNFWRMTFVDSVASKLSAPSL